MGNMSNNKYKTPDLDVSSYVMSKTYTKYFYFTIEEITITRSDL